MRIGYACISLTVDARTNRRLTLKNFSEEKFLHITKCNLEDLKAILENNLKNDIRLFRISSDIIPLGSHPANTVPWQRHFQRQLTDLGTFIKSNHMRVSMHPGQYTVLNSPKEDVVKKAVSDLEYHALFLDSLQVDCSNKLVLHVGGAYGNKSEAINRFCNNYNKLSSSVKSRLVIENDEKNFSLSDVLWISNEVDIPVIFDNLHHQCNHEREVSLDEIMNQVSKTWTEKDGPVKVHYSQQDVKKKTGAHSQTIDVKDFLTYADEVAPFDPDIMLEVKDKDLSAIKCTLLLKNMKKGC